MFVIALGEGRPVKRHAQSPAPTIATTKRPLFFRPNAIASYGSFQAKDVVMNARAPQAKQRVTRFGLSSRKLHDRVVLSLSRTGLTLSQAIRGCRCP